MGLDQNVIDHWFGYELGSAWTKHYHPFDKASVAAGALLFCDVLLSWWFCITAGKNYAQIEGKLGLRAGLLGGNYSRSRLENFVTPNSFSVAIITDQLPLASLLVVSRWTCVPASSHVVELPSRHLVLTT